MKPPAATFFSVTLAAAVSSAHGDARWDEAKPAANSTLAIEGKIGEGDWKSGSAVSMVQKQAANPPGHRRHRLGNPLVPDRPGRLNVLQERKSAIG
ncbi:MAG: hypothetical protein R3F11_29125 [Verrucomicrobiales bacterium]